jgi:hypothetical protein
MPVDDVLTEFGRRWRDGQPPVPAYDVAALLAAEAEPVTQRRRRWLGVAAVAAAAVLVVAGLAVVGSRATSAPGHRPVPGSTVPWCASDLQVMQASQSEILLRNNSEHDCALAAGPTDVVFSGPGGRSVAGTFTPAGSLSARPRPRGTTASVVLRPEEFANAGVLTVSPGGCMTSGGHLNSGNAQSPVALDTLSFSIAPGVRLTHALEWPVTGTCGLPSYVVASTWTVSPAEYDACAAATTSASADGSGDQVVITLTNTGNHRCDPGPGVWQTFSAQGRLGSHQVAVDASATNPGTAVGNESNPVGRAVLPGESWHVAVTVQHTVAPCPLAGPGSVSSFDVELSGGFGVVHAALPTPLALPPCSRLVSNGVWYTLP